MKILGYVSLVTLLFSFIGIGVMLNDPKMDRFSVLNALLLNGTVLAFIVKAMIALGLF